MSKKYARETLFVRLRVTQRLGVAARFVVTRKMLSLGFRCLLKYEWGITVWAVLWKRFVPNGEITIGVVAATVKWLAAAASAFAEVAVTVRLRTVDSNVNRLRILAFRVSRASEEFTSGATGSDNHRFPTFVAYLIRFFRLGRLRRFSLQRFGIPAFGKVGATEKTTVSTPFNNHLIPALVADLLRFLLHVFASFVHLVGSGFQSQMKWLIKISQNLDPVHFAIGYSIKLFFQFGGELNLKNIGEPP